MGNPRNVTLGAGTIFAAPLGTAEPVDLATAWAAAWGEIGYTEEGNTFSYELSNERIEVAEELDAVKIATTGRNIKVAFSHAELTLENLARALNGGAIVADAAAGGPNFSTYTPPELGAETRIMLGWESEDGEERWVFRQCFQTGNVEVARKKAPNKALIPVEFTLEKPAGVPPFKTIFATARV